jgi:hypothetical protein
MADDIADFVRRKAGIQGNRHVMQPEFGLIGTAADVNMRRFIAFV